MVDEMLDSYLFTFENFLLTPSPQWALLDYISYCEAPNPNQSRMFTIPIIQKRFEC